MTYTQVTRQQLNRTKPEFALRSSSVPAKSQSLRNFETDSNDMYKYSSHKYGCATLPLSRSSDHSSLFKTISHTSFTSPIPELSKSYLRSSSSLTSLRPSSTMTGFTRNTQSFQGAGWLGVTHASRDKWTTEYRSKITPAKPMHNPPLRPNTRSLIKNTSFCI